MPRGPVTKPSAFHFGSVDGELRLDEEFERLPLRADEAPDTLDAAQRRLFAADLLDPDLAGGEPGENGVQRNRAVDLPAEGDIFTGAFAHDQAAGVRVGPEGEVGRRFLGERHADRLRRRTASIPPGAANSTSTYPSCTAP